jgi:hypothetical protein
VRNGPSSRESGDKHGVEGLQVLAVDLADKRLQDLLDKAKDKEYKDDWPAERRDLEQAVAEFIKASREELHPRADR